MRAFDIAVVTEDGELTSRWRALCRAVAAWSLVTVPVWLLAADIAGLGRYFNVGLGLGLVGGAWVIFAAGAAWAVANPDGGLQDRIAGTYLVPR